MESVLKLNSAAVKTYKTHGRCEGRRRPQLRLGNSDLQSEDWCSYWPLFCIFAFGQLKFCNIIYQMFGKIGKFWGRKVNRTGPFFFFFFRLSAKIRNVVGILLSRNFSVFIACCGTTVILYYVVSSIILKSVILSRWAILVPKPLSFQKFAEH